MIYVISEDNFFAIGLMATLEDAGMLAFHTNAEGFGKAMSFVTERDIILFCAESRPCSFTLAQLAQRTKGKVVSFIDTVTNENIVKFNSICVMSKKISKKRFIDSIKSLEDGHIIKCIYLTEREKRVMNLFAQQEGVPRIARILKLSQKTVSGHKSNALHKMRLNHLNARSVFLYETVFHACN